jgi:hypothetical protein
MHDGAEQGGLVGEAAVERALGDAGVPRDRFDAGGRVPLGQEQRGSDVEDGLAELLGGGQGWPAADPRYRDG